MESTKRILIVCPSEEMSSGLSRVLCSCKDVTIVETVSDLSEVNDSLVDSLGIDAVMVDPAAFAARTAEMADAVEPVEDDQEADVLSNREKEILAEVAKGLTNKEIADKLNISIFTVTTHRKNISQKTGIRSIAGLTVYAVMHGIIK